MLAWLMLAACAPDPHVTRVPVVTPVHQLLDGTHWNCTWVAFVNGKAQTIEHEWTFTADRTVTTDIADRMRDALVEQRIAVRDALTMDDFLEFRVYGFPFPRPDRDLREVQWHGVGADTLLIDFAVESWPAEKWTVVPSGIDTMHLDRDGEEAWAISCRLAP